MTVEFSHGGDIEELRVHLEGLGLGLGLTESRLIEENPDHLIMWRDVGVLVGHTIWHPSNAKVHPDGEEREAEDRRILEEELSVVGDFIELHEIWLSDDHRGKGYGARARAWLVARSSACLWANGARISGNPISSGYPENNVFTLLSDINAGTP